MKIEKAFNNSCKLHALVLRVKVSEGVASNMVPVQLISVTEYLINLVEFELSDLKS